MVETRDEVGHTISKLVDIVQGISGLSKQNETQDLWDLEEQNLSPPQELGELMKPDILYTGVPLQTRKDIS